MGSFFCSSYIYFYICKVLVYTPLFSFLTFRLSLYFTFVCAFYLQKGFLLPIKLPIRIKSSLLFDKKRKKNDLKKKKKLSYFFVVGMCSVFFSFQVFVKKNYLRRKRVYAVYLRRRREENGGSPS